MAKILVVDDDPRLRELLVLTFQRDGHVVVTASDGRAALIHAAREAPDLIVLDIGLPEIDGIEVCRRIRQTSAVPILFLSARDEEVDRILGLELGADGYVTKPFSPRELVARVKAILKRSGPAMDAAVMRHGALSIKPARHRCVVRGSDVTLTATEMGLLTQLLRRADQMLTRPQMIDAVWGPRSQVWDRTLDSHLRNLRAKLGAAGLPDALQTLHGIGLRLGPCLGPDPSPNQGQDPA
jgi:two-component system OmpR family response regulator